MAMTKRKESAALFELLDKSTLKVPKNAGSLKIPNWWGSKSNPPAVPAKGASIGAPKPKERGALAGTGAGSTVKASAAPAAEAVPGATEEQGAAKDPLFDEAPALPAQPRLFDPPPQNVQPQNTPSIRPPTIGVVPVNIVPLKLEPQGGAGPTEADEAGASVAEAEPAARMEPQTAPASIARPVVEEHTERPAQVPAPIAEPAADTTGAVAGEAKVVTQPAPKPAPAMPAKVATTVPAKAAVKTVNRVIAPQTHDPKRLLAPRPGALARVPLWVILSAVAGVILVLGLVVYVAKGFGKGKTNTTTEQVRTAQSGPSIGMQGTTPPQPVMGHIYEQKDGHSAIQYKPELYYVVICYTPSRPKMLEYANFLAQHGEDVAIEIKQEGNEQLYALVGVKAFATAETAKRHRDDLVRLGDTWQRGVWKDANVYKDIRGH